MPIGLAVEAEAGTSAIVKGLAKPMRAICVGLRACRLHGTFATTSRCRHDLDS